MLSRDAESPLGNVNADNVGVENKLVLVVRDDVVRVRDDDDESSSESHLEQ